MVLIESLLNVASTESPFSILKLSLYIVSIVLSLGVLNFGVGTIVYLKILLIETIKESLPTKNCLLSSKEGVTIFKPL